MKTATKIATTAATLTTLMTGAAMADSCGVESIQTDRGWDAMTAGHGTEPYLNEKVTGILDNIVCRAQGFSNGYENGHFEMTSETILLTERLRNLGANWLVSANIQDPGQTGPATLESSSVHMNMTFNPLMTENENAIAGLALLKEFIDRGITGETTGVECVYRAEQVQCKPKVSLDLTP